MILVAAACLGCAGGSKYNRLLVDHRELQRTCSQKGQSLSRENQVLYEARIELERENALLTNEVESLRSRLESDSAEFASYKERTRQKIREAEQRAKGSEESSSRRIQEMSKRNQEVMDSLIAQMDALSVQLSAARTKSSTDIQALKDELARRKFKYEKELYALEKMKEELFRRLQDNERTIQELRTQTSTASSAQSADSLRRR